MNTKKVPVWAVIVIILSILAAGIGLSFIAPYNKIVSLEETVEARQGDIQSELQEKMDKISEMLPLVQSYVDKNSALQDELDDLKSALSDNLKISSDASLSELEEADEASTRFINDLSAAAAADSTQSSSVLSDYMITVEGIENRLSIARMNYNEAVKEYNTYIRKFPHNIVAGLFGFESLSSFQADS